MDITIDRHSLFAHMKDFDTHANVLFAILISIAEDHLSHAMTEQQFQERFGTLGAEALNAFNLAK
jgi:hypothetical protein